MTGARLDGIEGWEQTYGNSQARFSQDSFDLGEMSSPKRFECVKMNLDTGAAVKHVHLTLVQMELEMEEFVEQPVLSAQLDGGPWQFQGYDENGLCRSLERKTHWCTQSFVQCGRNRV